MGSIYKRGDTYYIRFKDQHDVWRSRSASANRKEAESALAAVEKGVAQLRMSQPSSVNQTPAAPRSTDRLRDCTEAWLAHRRKKKLRNLRNDEGHLKNHILPALGDKIVSEIRVTHIAALIASLQGTKLAPRTIRKIYGTVHKLFTDLVRDEVITHSPAVLTKDDLPKNRDKTPTWRSNAVFAREEVQLLISSDAVPMDRRVLYAILFLAGTRFGEAAGLRWSDFDTHAKPLKRVTIAHSYENLTKTEQPREVPVHPLLATILTEWKAKGWPAMMGRAATADDLVIPSRERVMRSSNQARNKFFDDLDRLGLRKRRMHDARRTFISLARADGARVDHLEHITHGKRGDIMNIYTTLPWETLCAAVRCLRIKRIASDIYELPKKGKRGGGLGTDPATPETKFVTKLVTSPKARARSVQKSWKQLDKARPAAGGGGGNRTRVRE